MNRLLNGLFLTVLWVIPAFASEPGKVALIQTKADSHFGDYLHNRALLTAFAKEAVSNGANIIVFSEGSSYGYQGNSKHWCLHQGREKGESCADVSTVAEKVPGGESTSYWAQFARENKIYLLFSVPEIEGGVYFNTVGVVGPDGYIGKYRKRFLTPTDALYAIPGNDSLVIDTPYGCFGILICRDLADIRLSQHYKQRGVTNVLMSANFFGGSYYKDYVERAKINVYVAESARCDATGSYCGECGVWDRGGLAPGESGIAYHVLKPPMHNKQQRRFGPIHLGSRLVHERFDGAEK